MRISKASNIRAGKFTRRKKMSILLNNVTDEVSS